MFPICHSSHPSKNNPKHSGSTEDSLSAVFITRMKYNTVNPTLEMKALYNLLFIRQADLPQSLFIVCLFC